VAGPAGRTASSSPVSAPNGGFSPKIFANPDMPEIDDYYEPFDFD
jgi:nitrate reductase beta subunit